MAILKSSVAITEEQSSTNMFNVILNRLIPGFNTSNISVLRLEGIIGDVTSFKSSLKFHKLNKLIEKSFKVKNLQAVFLIINSPGGSPVQSELIASRIINLSKEKNVPVYSFVEDMAASGGYWLACAGERIFASKNSVVGSIGVRSSGFGFTKAIEKLGIERRVLTQGKNKSILDPFMPVKDSDVELITAIHKDIHKNFIEYVLSRRGNRVNPSINQLFQGDIWTGERALDLGLIDGIEDIFSFIKKHYPKSNIKYIEDNKSWFKNKIGLKNNEFHNLTLDIVNALEHKNLESRFKIF